MDKESNGDWQPSMTRTQHVAKKRKKKQKKKGAPNRVRYDGNVQWNVGHWVLLHQQQRGWRAAHTAKQEQHAVRPLMVGE